jgi:hypothetical protein
MAGLSPDGPAPDRVLAAAAATGLASSRLTLGRRPLDDATWSWVLNRANAERATGLLAAAIQTGALVATADQEDQVRRAHVALLQTCLLLEDHLLTVSHVLDAVGVEPRVVKGPAVAHLDYPDPSWRGFGDIDLLLRAPEYDGAIRALEAAGFERGFREVRPGFDRRFGKGVSLVGPSGFELDVHRTFAMGPYGLSLDTGTLWASSSSFVLAGRTFDALDPDLRLLHACYHAALGRHRPGLVPLRDVAGMLLRSSDPVDRDRVQDVARAWRAEAVLARAVRLAWDLFDLEEDTLSRWAGAYRPAPRDLRWLRVYLDPHMGYAARSIVGLQAVPGWRQKAAFAWALAVPSRDYGAGRYGGRWERWRSAGRQVAALTRRGPKP